MYICLCYASFLHCSPTITSLSMSLLTGCSCWLSLIISCIDMLSHLGRSCSSVFPCASNQGTIITVIKCAPLTTISNPIYYYYYFYIDLNADVALVTAPIETAACWAVCVTEAPAICAPTINPYSRLNWAWLDFNLLTVPHCTGVEAFVFFMFLHAVIQVFP